MFAGLKRAVLTTMIVSGAFLVYASVAVPLIEPAAGQRRAETTVYPENVSTLAALKLESLFKPDDWERGKPIVLKTDRGVLLLQEYRTLDDGRLELKPCTLILLDTEHEDQSKQQPVVLQSKKGALLRFDKPMDLSRGQFGRLEGGWLVGPVSIERQASEGADDGLQIHTGNVQITQERVIAPQKVLFRYGRNFGSGKDLIIAFDPPSASKGSNAKSDFSFGQLRGFELVHVDQLNLYTDTAERAQTDSATDGKENPQLPELITVNCDGPFRFDLRKQLASFQDAVRVTGKNGGSPDDQLTCDLLQIYFRSKPEKAADRASKADRDLSSISALEVSQIVFRGTPAVLDSPSQSASVRAQQFEYNFHTGQIRVVDQKVALLRYQDHEFEGAAIEYVPTEDGRIGRLLAEGPGRIRGSLPEEPDKKFEASWKERFVIQPHMGDHAVSLISDARVTYQGMGQFSAKNLHLWLEEIEEKTGPKEKPKFTYRPVRLLADQKVDLDSLPLTAKTEKAEVWIRYEEPTPAVAATAKPKKLRPGDKKQEFTGGQRYDLAGRHLQAQLLRIGDETVVEHLILNEDIRLRETATAKPNEIPLDVVGDAVHVEFANTPQARVRIQGAPAKVSARGMAMSGDSIQLNRQTNRLWIAGPGEMTLPVPAERLNLEGGPVSATAKDATMNVTWKGRMDFDGRMAKLHGDVQARGQQESDRGEVFDILVMGNDLEVSTTERVDFSREKQSRDLDVRQLLFRGGVFLQNTTHRLGRQISVDRMQVYDLTIDQQTDRLQASGPGWGTSVRYEEKDSTESASRGLRRSDSELNFVRIDFEDEVVGNLKEHDLEFRGRVRSMYGPVEAWDQELDPDPRDGLAEDVYLLSSDRLAMVQMKSMTPGGKSSLDIIADGNATIEGDDFNARGWRISYTDAKELLILEGDGRNDAELWLQGSVTPDAAAQQIRFWTHNNSFQVDGGRFFNLGQMGSVSR